MASSPPSSRNRSAILVNPVRAFRFFLRVAAHPVIGNGKRNISALSAQPHFRLASFTMPGDIAQGLLRHPEQAEPHSALQASAKTITRAVDLNSMPFRYLAEQALRRNSRSQQFKFGGVQLMRQGADLLGNVTYILTELHQGRGEIKSTAAVACCNWTPHNAMDCPISSCSSLAIRLCSDSCALRKRRARLVRSRSSRWAP